MTAAWPVVTRRRLGSSYNSWPNVFGIHVRSSSSNNARIDRECLYGHARIEHIVAVRNLILLRRKELIHLIDRPNESIETAAKTMFGKFCAAIGLVRSRVEAIPKLAKLAFDFGVAGVQFGDSSCEKYLAILRPPQS